MKPGRDKVGSPVVRCPEEIPCNVCEPACPSGALRIGQDIVGKVEFSEQRCTGCGLCVAACPALAITLVNKTYTREEALVTFPYERLPIPEEGDIVLAVDDKGKPLTSVRVVRVDKRKNYDRTVLVSVALSREDLERVRDIILPLERHREVDEEKCAAA